MRKIGVTLAVLLLSAAIVQAQTVVSNAALTLHISSSGEATLVNNTASNVAFKSYIIKTSADVLRNMTNGVWSPVIDPVTHVDSGNYTWFGVVGADPDTGDPIYDFVAPYDGTRWTPVQERAAYLMDASLWKLPKDGGAGIMSNLGNTGPENGTGFLSGLSGYSANDTGVKNGLNLWAIPNQDSNTTRVLAETAMSTSSSEVFWVRPASGTYIPALISLGKIVNAFSDSATATALQNLFYTPTGGAHTFQWGGPGGEYYGQVVVDGAAVPEPATMSLLVLGGLSALLRRRR